MPSDSSTARYRQALRASCLHRAFDLLKYKLYSSREDLILVSILFYLASGRGRKGGHLFSQKNPQ